ncbi:MULTISPECIES: inorganic phosphate transporter [unclassified Neochlamydia]|uniref:inorganic phosphate transporter n=1 Tax=unclassified Neochlamydia TaxID=2643326 RepID=UPI001A954BD8|nr:MULTISPECIES: inorganic phosphate transporter [unclassified Neochlamydia]MBS4167120.1 putative phosphate permease [Neochlamydia sp. AcF65]MBS4170268.1 putative phosphate permease [Neochlamydia sp. AcF95]NGY95578.1 putative phosphate permease [Neochlamydia sp. AcF84]
MIPDILLIPENMLLLIFLLLAGFYMAWSIGANDVANAMGTSVGSGALSLKTAVVIAALLEFSGAFFFGSHVSDTIQTGIIDSTLFAYEPRILVYGMLASLLAAGMWLQIASYFGWPVSTTHCIVGAIVGFGIVVGGLEAIQWENILFIITSWVISPILGGIISYFIFNILRKKIFYTPNPIRSAQKITPMIVFLTVIVMGLILVFKGLQNLNLEFTFLEALIFSAFLGTIGSFISYLLLRNISAPTRCQQPVCNAETSLSLDKARKHLLRARETVSGNEMHYHLSILLNEVDNVSTTIKKSSDGEVHKSEYATVEKIFGYLQIMSACLMAFAHGANDVANAIGPLSQGIQVLINNTVITTSTTPVWALALGGVGIVVGLATWGWRVIETIGKKITELTPTRGFAAEFGAATTVVLASRLGLPVSTTHTLVGSVVGVGLARGLEALDLSMTRDIMISWLVTVPTGALIAVGFFNAIMYLITVI